MPDEEFARLEDHPRRFTDDFRRLCSNPSAVHFDQKVNDLANARKIAMSLVWACMERGEVEGKVVRSELGRHANLSCEVAGQKVTLAVMIDNSSKPYVLFADAEEEEV